ncbi:alpha/beta hydrolase [Chryseobacterium sp. T1]
MKTTLLFTLVIALFSNLYKGQMDDKFYQPSKEMKALEFKNFENISLAVDKKDTITAIFLKPNQAEIKKTILFFHGANGNVTTYQYMVKPLVDNGYQVVMVDFRGYGKSTGKPKHANVASDGQKMLDYLLSRSDIKNTKLYIYGASLGSQIATHLAKENQAKISGLIIDGGMASFTDIAIHFSPENKEMIEKYMISPYSAKEDIKNLKDLPKLFIYSKGDTTVPFFHGQIIYQNAPMPKQFIEYSGEHLQAMVLDKDQVIKAIEKL